MRLCMQDRPAYVAWTAVHARGESCVSGSVSASVSVSECECELRVSVSWVWCAAMPVDGPDRALTRPPGPLVPLARAFPARPTDDVHTRMAADE